MPSEKKFQLQQNLRPAVPPFPMIRSITADFACASTASTRSNSSCYSEFHNAVATKVRRSQPAQAFLISDL
eukprot:g30609.t1